MTDHPCQTRRSCRPRPERCPAVVSLTELDGIRGGSPGPARGHRAVVRRESGRALAIRHSGDVLLGGAPGAGGFLLNTKASQEAACSCAPAAIVPGQEPESRDEGVSRFAGNGSHLAETDTAEDHAGQVDGPGSSGNTGTGSHPAGAGAAEGHAGHADGSGSSEFTKNGSHPAAADFSNEPGAVLWRHTPTRRTESGLLSYGTASPDSSVQKTALWRTRAHLNAGPPARTAGLAPARPPSAYHCNMAVDSCII